MKSFKLFVPLAILSLVVTAHAETDWAKTKYWQAPYEKTLTLKIQALDPSLKGICKDYSDLVRVGAPLDQEGINVVRALTGSIAKTAFSTQFEVKALESQQLIDASLARANAQIEAKLAEGAAQNPFFGYTQKTIELVPELFDHSMLEVKDQPGSLTSISRSVGLSPLAIFILGSGLNAKIKVYGKDVACDLLNGEAKLQLNSKVRVKIDAGEQQKLGQIYTQIEPLVQDSLKRKKTAKSRALLLGHKLATFFQAKGIDLDLGTIYTTNFVENFFDEEMNRNDAWKEYKGEWYLLVDGNASVNITFSLEK